MATVDVILIRLLPAVLVFMSTQRSPVVFYNGFCQHRSNYITISSVFRYPDVQRNSRSRMLLVSSDVVVTTPLSAVLVAIQTCSVSQDRVCYLFLATSL